MHLLANLCWCHTARAVETLEEVWQECALARLVGALQTDVFTSGAAVLMVLQDTVGKLIFVTIANRERDGIVGAIVSGRGVAATVHEQAPVATEAQLAADHICSPTGEAVVTDGAPAAPEAGLETSGAGGVSVDQPQRHRRHGRAVQLVGEVSTVPDAVTAHAGPVETLEVVTAVSGARRVPIEHHVRVGERRPRQPELAQRPDHAHAEPVQDHIRHRVAGGVGQTQKLTGALAQLVVRRDDFSQPCFGIEFGISRNERLKIKQTSSILVDSDPKRHKACLCAMR